MEGKIVQTSFHFIGYKHNGKFDQYETLVADAFKELATRLTDIPSRTDKTAALYEPQRGPEHTEGSFYVGVIVSEKPERVPAGSEYIHIDGRYASAKGQIKNMAAIYEYVGKWIEENEYKSIWPEAFFIERYDFPVPEDDLTLEEEVEVLLPIRE